MEQSEHLDVLVVVIETKNKGNGSKLILKSLFSQIKKVRILLKEFVLTTD